MRPSLNAFRLYGPRNGLILDEDQQTLIRCRGTRLKSYAERFIPPLDLARQQLGNWATNLRLFLQRDSHMKSGMKCLIESFYRSITDGTPLPIPYREILLTSRIMDAIFQQLNGRGTKVAAGEEGSHAAVNPGVAGEAAKPRPGQGDSGHALRASSINAS
jgi:hypothetical protein